MHLPGLHLAAAPIARPKIPTVRVLGVDCADTDAAGAARWLAARPASAPFDYVVTPNADHFVRLAREPALRPIYDQALLRLLDSRVVARIARVCGVPAPAVATGTDLTARLLGEHIRPGERITIVGLTPAWLPALVERYGLGAPAHFNPAMGFERDPRAFAATIRFVQANPARFVFLAVGSPRQEMLAAAIKARGGSTGTALCIGAALEFLAGAIPRAPEWMRSAALEWLYRLACDPRRLARRYLIDDPPIFALMLRERARQRAGRLALRQPPVPGLDAW